MKMAYYDDVLINATEFIKDRFFFISIKTNEKPKSTACTHYFSIDNELIYESFFNDFGPLNISMLYHYCVKVNKKLKSLSSQKRVVHYTSYNEQKRVNAAFLACSYMIIYWTYTPELVYEALAAHNSMEFIDFRDASVGMPYTINLLDCLNAIYKAHNYGFFNFDNFDFLEYEHYERVENGDLNWILPRKFIGFCGPHNKSTIGNGYPLHCPETYFPYFRRHKVTTIIRLNRKMYEASKFVKAGFVHKDLYFIDGSTPSDKIVSQFLSICEKTNGAVAVHCKAGLGRTGTLIGCYIMKHYKFTAHETIAWIRICRPGSIIGHQQNWLESKQAQMWKAGEEYRAKLGITELPRHTKGIYNYNRGPEFATFLRRLSKKNDVSGILQKVDTMQLEDKETVKEEDDDTMTQGDHLNQMKARRRSRESRQVVATNGTSERKVYLRSSIQRTANSSVTVTNGEVKTPRVLRSTIPNNGSITRNISAVSTSRVPNGELTESKIKRRTKRSLTVEKERSSSRSVKLLRRCKVQSSSDITIKPKFHLPKVTKMSKTP